MKIFQRYNPLQVAKYVKILFRGRLYIKDVGAFEFDKGKILIPKVKDKLHLSVMSEVNRQVMRLQTECIDSLEVRKKPGGHWIIRDLMGLDLVGLASL